MGLFDRMLAKRDARRSGRKQEKWAMKRQKRLDRGAMRLERLKAKESQLGRIAATNEVPVEDAAAQYLSYPQPNQQLNGYIQSQGETPLPGVANAATQAYMLRQQQLAQAGETIQANEGQQWPDELNEQYMLGEEMEYDGYDEDNDSFLPILAAIGTIGKKGSELIRQNRYAKGKKFLGESKADFEKRKASTREQRLADGSASGIDIAAEALDKGKRSYVDQTITGWIKSNWIVVVLVGVALVAGFLYLSKGRKTKAA